MIGYQLYNKDCRRMDDLPDESVQGVVTSPPYWGLRKYSGDQDLVWGDGDCEHEWGQDIQADTRSENFKDWGNKGSGIEAPHIKVSQGNFCSLCGSWRGAYGLEPTPEMYVQHTIEILREIRRVLRKDGVCFLNLGDSYASSNTSPTRSRPDLHVPACGNNGKGFLNWKECGCACPCHDDERLNAQLKHTSGNALQVGTNPSLHLTIDHDSEPVDSLAILPDGVPHASPVSNNFASSQASQVNPSVRFCSDCLESHYSASRTSYSLGTLYHIPKLKAKDLCLIPFRVAIAAQEDGWWVRSIIIWSKPNPMPESVQDRPTESHEYLLMLTQSGKSLYWTHRDQEGTRERPKADYRWVNQLTQEEVPIAPADWKVKIKCPDCDGTGNVNKEIGWYIQEDKCSTCDGKGKTTLWKRTNLWRGHDYYWDASAVREQSTCTSFGSDQRDTSITHGLGSGNSGINEAKRRAREQGSFGGRNIRTVWEFPTQPYPQAHFAVFPEKLPELCIKAATPEVGCCSKCGAPWERITVRKSTADWQTRKEHGATGGAMDRGANQQQGKGMTHDLYVDVQTLGWKPTCSCNADKVPSLVLDPFMGAGTTLLSAIKLGRRAVGYEISDDYCEMSHKRLNGLQIRQL